MARTMCRGSNISKPQKFEKKSGLLGTRFKELAKNTVDYWEIINTKVPTYKEVINAFETAPVFTESTFQIYVHVPFCCQNCMFCAFYEVNTPDNALCEKYAELIVWQLDDLINRSVIKGKKITSIHIGGGSPNFIGSKIGLILNYIRSIPECKKDTEISVELNVATTQENFIKELINHNVTKVSFGIQSIDPTVRKYMKLPKDLFYHMDRVLGLIDGKIPIINADLLTSLPGQNIEMVKKDIEILQTKYPEINAISSYLLALAFNPYLISELVLKRVPPQASDEEQALMRIETIEMLKKDGWIRKGMNTYVNPVRIKEQYLNMISGNESIGQGCYESFLLSVGPSAVGNIPGLRYENYKDVKKWCDMAKDRIHPYNLEKCSLIQQKDIAFWIFPLRYKGLSYKKYDRLKKSGSISEQQIDTLENLIKEDLVFRGVDGFLLTTLGEVFMGNIARELKKPENRDAVDKTINKGFEHGLKLAKKIKKGTLQHNCIK